LSIFFSGEKEKPEEMKGADRRCQIGAAGDLFDETTDGGREGI